MNSIRHVVSGTPVCAAQVTEAEKEGAVQKALAQGWQREAALLEPQLQYLQTQLTACKQQVCTALSVNQCSSCTYSMCCGSYATYNWRHNCTYVVSMPLTQN